MSTNRRLPFAIVAAGLAMALAAGAVASGPDSSATQRLARERAVNIDPADFTTRIDNSYWPIR
jgi:hypothetical protein